MANIGVSICGLDFPNPVLPAAGPPTRNGEACLAAVRGGAGGIVTKTVSVEPALIPRPCMAEIKGGFLNSELWSELSVERWLESEYRLAREGGVPLIVSLGYTADQIAALVPRVAPLADALELSTHYVGQDISPIVDALQAAKRAADLPVLVKMSPHENILEIARGVEEAGADALVMINSFGPCLAVDVETGLPLMGSERGYGWLSGTAIRTLALRCVFEAAGVVKIPIFGAGGISGGRQAAEMLMAGASAVQVCTAAILKGPQVYGQIASELNDFLDSHGYQDLSEIVGLTRRRIRERSLRTTAVAPEVDQQRCNLCGRCAVSCPYQAITRSDRLLIDTDRCFGCGLCVSRCPRSALTIRAIDSTDRSSQG